MSELEKISRAYELRNGAAYPCELNAWRDGDVDNFFAVAARPAPGAVAFLTQIAYWAARQAPWARVWAVPVLRNRVGADAAPWYGQDAAADGSIHVLGAASRSRIVFSLSEQPRAAAETYHHELYHSAEHVMPECDRDAVRDVFERHGLEWSGGWMSDRRERVARGFEAWARSIVEGYPPRPTTTALGFEEAVLVDRVFAAVLSGDLGRRWRAEQTRIAAERRQAEARARRVSAVRGFFGIKAKEVPS